MSSDPLEGFRQGLFLSSILTGFSITVVIELISISRKNRIVSLAIGAFILSAALLLVSTVAGTFMIVTASTWLSTGTSLTSPSWQSLISFGGLGGNILFLGLVAFLVGIGLTGWLQSKVIGIFSTVVTALSLVTIVAVILYLSGLSAP